MDAAYNTVGQAVGSVGHETRPLEDLTRIADALQVHAEILDAYLERFNGPRPTEVAEAMVPPRCYRGEIDRLDSLARRVGSITDLIQRLG